MRTRYHIVCLLLLGGSLLKAQTYSLPFRDGEQLEYLLHYGPVSGGVAKLSIRQSTLNSTPVYHAKAEARTIGVADKIYKVKDIYESFMDPSSGLPVKAIRNISEGRYRYYDENMFLRDSNVVVSQKVGRMKVPAGISDMVSALYLLRRTNTSGLHIGDTIKLVTYFANEIYPLKIRYRGKETIRTKLGKYRCLVFAPVTEVGRVFKTEDDMLMWISDDRNFVPIRIMFDMWVGSMRIDLVSYKNLMYELKPVD